MFNPIKWFKYLVEKKIAKMIKDGELSVGVGIDGKPEIKFTKRF